MPSLTAGGQVVCPRSMYKPVEAIVERSIVFLLCPEETTISSDIALMINFFVQILRQLSIARFG